MKNTKNDMPMPPVWVILTLPFQLICILICSFIETIKEEFKK
tara:strand:+ start:1323 stop:1448 length:126 start_codon:yes stop_codon:yes gene_type:complete